MHRDRHPRRLPHDDGEGRSVRAPIFKVVAVPPPDEAETVRIAMGVKQQYEQFHGVMIADDAIDAAISASRWFLQASPAAGSCDRPNR